jgi:16S rRNA (guanine527-N7)-methyltransferase
MDTLAAGAASMGLSLTGRQLDQFERYYRELIARNRDVNLTRITGYEDVQVRHFLDSLSGLPLMGPLAGRRVIDVGTGAGLPGIPVKICVPEVRLTLLEATGKKADFLRGVVASLDLADVEVIAGRAEELGHAPAFREAYDFVLARAVAALPALAELMLPLCRPGGRCIAYKKGDVAGEARQAEKAVALMGGRVAPLHRVDLIAGENDRYLVVMEKTQPTPEKYPRRPGIPVKRPVL